MIVSEIVFGRVPTIQDDCKESAGNSEHLGSRFSLDFLAEVEMGTSIPCRLLSSMAVGLEKATVCFPFFSWAISGISVGVCDTLEG